MQRIRSDPSTSDAQIKADTGADAGVNESQQPPTAQPALDAAFFLAIVEGLGQHAKCLRASRSGRDRG